MAQQIILKSNFSKDLLSEGAAFRLRFNPLLRKRKWGNNPWPGNPQADRLCKTQRSDTEQESARQQAWNNLSEPLNHFVHG